MVGKDFNNISQRVIYAISGLFSEFMPIETIEVDETSQRQFYDFLRDFISAIYNNASLLNLSLDKDECEDRPADGKHYLETRKLMRKTAKTIEDFYTLLVYISRNGIMENDKIVVNAKQIKLNKVKRTALECSGIICNKDGENYVLHSVKYPHITDAWFNICRTQDELGMLVRGIFESNENAVLKLLGNVMNKANIDFSAHLDYFKANNYTFKWNIGLELTEFFFTNSVSGFCVGFDRRKYNQIGFGVINHRNFKAMLEDFYELDESFQDFIVNVCRKCNSCKQCTKGNPKTALFYKTVTHKNEELNLCPSFPSFGWHSMDDALMKNILICIELQEKYALD